MPRGRARVGCSGWQYKHWRGDFYPADLPQAKWFEHYAARFDTVEINNSFYRLPERATFAAWARRAPMKFEFAVKASRFLTHMKKLKDPEEPIDRLFSRMRALGTHLGPVLYGEERLRGWSDWLNAQREEGCDVYAYFNNDVGGHAPRDAVTLRRLLEE